MKNVTISVDQATKRDVSISRFIAGSLEERMAEEATCEVTI